MDTKFELEWQKKKINKDKELIRFIVFWNKFNLARTKNMVRIFECKIV